MKKVIFFHGEKGGVGKSFAATTYLETYIAEHGTANVIAVDGDTSNPDFGRKAKHGGLPVLLIDFRETAGWGVFSNTVEGAPADAVFVVSLPSQVKLWSSEIDTLVAAFAEIGHIDVTVYWTIGRLRDSIELLSAAMASVSPEAGWKWIVVKNLFWTAGQEDQFQLFDVFNEHAKLPAINLPALDALLSDRIHQGRISFSGALSKDSGFFAHDRSKLLKFLKQSGAEFARV